jgi:hypothetical protein
VYTKNESNSCSFFCTALAIVDVLVQTGDITTVFCHAPRRELFYCEAPAGLMGPNDEDDWVWELDRTVSGGGDSSSA